MFSKLERLLSERKRKKAHYAAVRRVAIRNAERARIKRELAKVSHIEWPEQRQRGRFL